MILVILWLIQDFLTVLFGGAMQIPGLFILGIVYKLLSGEGGEDVNLWAIWSAFAGGILWDLRWIGIPGFFTLGNVVVILIVIQSWGTIPPQGRGGGNEARILIFMLLEISQIVPPLLPVLILGVSNTGWTFILEQQIYSLPAIFVVMYLYMKHGV